MNEQMHTPPAPRVRKKPKLTLLQIFGSVILLGIVLTVYHVMRG
jgi:hypothetical protein